MGFFSWILFGLIAGAIAKLIMPGRQGGGFILTVLLGVVGALVGGWMGTVMGFGTLSGFDLRSLAIAIAIAGALVVLFLFGMARRAD
ncbi:MAG TPA: GlsB/YeaQ/YmgE family stress response membrane protein [Plasticicumulans sp.]|nr:GlsB/YeaQ/YmgE family stress response membrane protein [Plasticicumulans sp.]HNF66787.1 GlsB/YeaQ/YmgE family stress response membrane protein [Plasticicumulans sp.]